MLRSMHQSPMQFCARVPSTSSCLAIPRSCQHYFLFASAHKHHIESIFHSFFINKTFILNMHASRQRASELCDSRCCLLRLEIRSLAGCYCCPLPGISSPISRWTVVPCLSHEVASCSPPHLHLRWLCNSLVSRWVDAVSVACLS